MRAVREGLELCLHAYALVQAPGGEPRYLAVQKTYHLVHFQQLGDGKQGDGKREARSEIDSRHPDAPCQKQKVVAHAQFEWDMRAQAGGWHGGPCELLARAQAKKGYGGGTARHTVA